jgi:hypothetical protein
MKRIGILLCMFLGFSLSARGQAPAPDQDKMKALEERVRALEAELQSLKAAMGTMQASATAAPAPVAAAAPVVPPPSVAAPQTGVIGGAPQSGKALNPDISIVGNFLGAVGHNTVRPVNSLEMAESEVGLQAIIDPYARGDVFISFGESGVDVEEAYLTFTSLPGGFVTRVGKMRSAFGKVNTLHSHNLPWIDRPLVTENLLGGEEGISDAGFSVTRILPAPRGIYLEGTGQVFRGDSADVFTANRKQDASVIGHLRGYGDINESTNLDMGFSYGRGHTAEGSLFLANLYGIDATLRWKPLRRAIYKNFMARTELVWSRRDTLLGGPAAERAFGLFTSGEYRINRRWTVGGRYDRSGRATDASMTDTGFSTLLTYWPSEFSQIRGQYRFARYAEGRDGNELRFQFLFVMGAHGAHPF